MIATSLLPVPALPEALATVLWVLAILGSFAAALWLVFRWLLARIDERFRAAIEGETFRVVVDQRVAAAFSGATAPLLTAQNRLAGDIAVAAQAANAAHRRLDEHLEDHAGLSDRRRA